MAAAGGRPYCSLCGRAPPPLLPHGSSRLAVSSSLLWRLITPPPWRRRRPVPPVAAAAGQPYCSPCVGAAPPLLPRVRRGPAVLPSLLWRPVTPLPCRRLRLFPFLEAASGRPNFPPCVRPAPPSAAGRIGLHAVMLRHLSFLMVVASRPYYPPCCGMPSPPLHGVADAWSLPWQSGAASRIAVPASAARHAPSMASLTARPAGRGRRRPAVLLSLRPCRATTPPSPLPAAGRTALAAVAPRHVP